MKILLDEMLPAGVARLLPEHEVVTVQLAGYRGLTNGDLLRRASVAGYGVLLTADQNLPAQQNIKAAGIAVVLVRGSKVAEVAAQSDAPRAAIAGAQPGTVIRVEPGELRLQAACRATRREQLQRGAPGDDRRGCRARSGHVRCRHAGRRRADALLTA